MLHLRQRYQGFHFLSVTNTSDEVRGPEHLGHFLVRSTGLSRFASFPTTGAPLKSWLAGEGLNLHFPA